MTAATLSLTDIMSARSSPTLTRSQSPTRCGPRLKLGVVIARDELLAEVQHSGFPLVEDLVHHLELEEACRVEDAFGIDRDRPSVAKALDDHRVMLGIVAEAVADERSSPVSMRASGGVGAASRAGVGDGSGGTVRPDARCGSASASPARPVRRRRRGTGSLVATGVTFGCGQPSSVDCGVACALALATGVATVDRDSTVT